MDAGEVINNHRAGVPHVGNSQAEANQNSKHVVGIDDARARANAKPHGPQTPANTNRFSAHLWTRRSIVRMFLVGATVRHIARFHKVAEVTVENELRAQIPFRKAA